MPTSRRAAHSIIASVAIAIAAAGCGQRSLQTGNAGTSSPSIGTMEQSQLTVSASTMEELIRNRFPGILRQSGGRSWIEIRGPSSISSSTEALIIVDGIQSSTAGLLSMNPDDVQRMQVLRDGSAAIYGVRGGNGVLVVTTRRQRE